MINVTDRAEHQLKRLVNKLGESRNWAPDDQFVEHEGTAILLIGREISRIVGDSMIDCEETGGQARLIVRRAA